jgi:hypothetical protein
MIIDAGRFFRDQANLAINPGKPRSSDAGSPKLTVDQHFA